MLFIIVEMVHPDTSGGLSDINKNLETTRMSNLKHDIPKDNLQISEWMNKISINAETYP